MKKLTEFLGRIFDNDKSLRYVLAAFVVAFFALLATTCRAEAAEVFALGGSTYIRGTTPMAGLGLEFELNEKLDATLDCSVGLIGSSKDRGVDVGNQAFARCMVWDGIWKVDLGLGGAFLQNKDHYNGSNFNFALGIRFNFNDHHAIEVGHFSNAGTTDVNKGRDFLGYRYKF